MSTKFDMVPVIVVFKRERSVFNKVGSLRWLDVLSSLLVLDDDKFEFLVTISA